VFKLPFLGVRVRGTLNRPLGGRDAVVKVESRSPAYMYAVHKNRGMTTVNIVEMLLISIFIFLTPILLLLGARER